jgi:hypothetical protein
MDLFWGDKVILLASSKRDVEQPPPIPIPISISRYPDR